MAGGPYARGSETWNQCLGRTATTLRQILERHAGQRVLIATHGETIEVAHVLLLDLQEAATGLKEQAVVFGC